MNTNNSGREAVGPRRRHTVGPREPVSGVVFLSLSFDARTELLLGPNNRVHMFIGHRFSEAVFKLKNQRYAERKLCPIKNSKKTMKGVPVR